MNHNNERTVFAVVDGILYLGEEKFAEEEIYLLFKSYFNEGATFEV